MIAVVTVLSAFALGYFLKARAHAMTAYAVAYLWAFVYQTLYLTLDAMNQANGGGAFQPQSFPLAYGLVTLAIFLVGFGLVEAGHRVRARRLARAVPATS